MQLRIAYPPGLNAEAAELFPVPIAVPFVNVVRHVVAAVGAGPIRIQANGRGSPDVEVKIRQARGRPVVAPRVTPAVGTAGGLLPLRVGGEPPADPTRIRIRLVPAEARHGLVRSVPTGLPPHCRPVDAPLRFPGPARLR